jgi:broad specificity phosphatase PhoE
MTKNILLVRHGRSEHKHAGWVDLAGFVREAYEAAGIDGQDRPPAALMALASASGIVAASPALRAVQSAKLLEPEREIMTSPLLGEMELTPPNFGQCASR